MATISNKISWSNMSMSNTSVNVKENQDSNEESSLIILTFEEQTKYIFPKGQGAKVLEALAHAKRLHQRYGKDPTLFAASGNIGVEYATPQHFKELELIHLINPDH